MVRILCPTYNRLDRLKRAVESYKTQQTSVPTMLTVIDNGCNPAVADTYKDWDGYSQGNNNIEVIKYAVNMNPVATINDYVEKNKSDIHTLLFDDDLFYDQDSLQKRIQPILDNRADTTYTDVMDFGQVNRTYIIGVVDIEQLRQNDCLYFGSMAWNETAWDKAGPLDETMWLQSDWLFKLKLFKYSRVEYVPEITMLAERHMGQELVKHQHRINETRIIKAMIHRGEL